MKRIFKNKGIKSLGEIVEFPTVIQDTHESVYRSYHILGHILLMVDRGDSKETIIEVAQLLQ